MPTTPNRDAPGALREGEELQLASNPGVPSIAGGIRYDGYLGQFQLRDDLGTFNPRNTYFGGLVLNISNKTSDYTLSSVDYTINYLSGTYNVTLPTAVGVAGQVYVVKNSGAGTITVLTTDGQIIDEFSSGFIKLSQSDNMTVQSDGANWIIVG